MLTVLSSLLRASAASEFDGFLIITVVYLNTLLSMASYYVH